MHTQYNNLFIYINIYFSSVCLKKKRATNCTMIFFSVFAKSSFLGSKCSVPSSRRFKGSSFWLHSHFYETRKAGVFPLGFVWQLFCSQSAPLYSFCILHPKNNLEGCLLFSSASWDCFGVSQLVSS